MLVRDYCIPSIKVPLIDLSLLSQDSHAKTTVIKEIHEACQKSGVFHVINHGIPKSVIEGALEVNKSFFNMPEDMKKDILDVGTRGDDVFRPVKLITFRCGAPGESDLIQRDVLRLHANPFEDFVDFWPNNPADYKEKMRSYTMGVRKLGLQLFEAIVAEALNLDIATNLKDNFEKGLHFFCINCYAAKQDLSVKIGAPCHSDHSIFTVLLQSSQGLQILDVANDGKWKADPLTEGSLQVFVGDHLEVLSNGIYKSLFHRVVPMGRPAGETRISITSFYSFEMDKIVEPAEELISEEFPKRYKGCSVKDILKHIASGKPDRLIDLHKI